MFNYDEAITVYNVFIVNGVAYYNIKKSTS